MDKSAQFTQDDMLRIGQSFCAMAESLSAAVTAAGAISTALVRCNVLTVQEQWVQTWGETVNKKTAGRMLGVSASQITNLINAGTLATSPDGRVLVRQAAEWANAKDQSKPGTILAIKPDPKGYPIKRSGQGKQGRRVCCSAVLRALVKRGISLDQTVDLEYDDQANV